MLLLAGSSVQPFPQGRTPGTVQILLNQGDRVSQGRSQRLQVPGRGRGGKRGGLVRTSDGQGPLLNLVHVCEETTEARKRTALRLDRTVDSAADQE